MAYARWFLFVSLLALAGCPPTGDQRQQETAALTLSSTSMATRQLETRRFDTKNEGDVLSATSAVLQDLGFTIEETSAQHGLVVGSKDRDAVEAGQVAGQIFLSALVAALGGRHNPQWDQIQKIRVSIVTRPSSDGAAVTVRVTFQRVVWDNHQAISHVDTIDDPIIYQQFFEKLSKAVFLEAHQI